MSRAEAHHSLWERLSIPNRPRIHTDMDVEVCVVGGGIAGIETAYRLARDGVDVVVLEAETVGSGQTGRTSAHLACIVDDGLDALVRWHGAEGARLAVQSHREAVDRIERTAAEEGIECDFKRVDAYLFACHSERELEEEFKAATEHHLVEASMASRAPHLLADCPAIRYPGQAQFHPLRYLYGLAEAAERRGARIFHRSHVMSIEETADFEFTVRTDLGATVRSKKLVVATNVPINDRYAIHTKQAPYRTSVLAFDCVNRKEPDCLLWDTADPYHYIRFHDGLVLVGGDDHRTGQPTPGASARTVLRDWAHSNLSGLGPERGFWSGQVIETPDGLAYIGQNPHSPKGVYIVTGDSGDGLTHSSIAGALLSDLIQSRANPLSALYDPGRVPVRALSPWIADVANAAFQYRDWLEPVGLSGIEELAAGEGGVFNDGLSKLAVYRDEDGELHPCSAVCPHLKGVVRWNAEETTWDCPCHGSRFDRYGKVIEGPAIHDLEPVEVTTGIAEPVRTWTTPIIQPLSGETAGT